jgi:hypothetical protein
MSPAEDSGSVADLSSLSPALHLRSVLRTIGLIVSGRLHFREDRLGEIIPGEDGVPYQVFREIVVDRRGDQPSNSGAIFSIRFQVENMSPAHNQLFSLLPIALYAGIPGFRSKVFTIRGSHCRSIYEWDTVADAERYAHSLAVRAIASRAVPGSVSWTIRSVPSEQTSIKP